MKSRFFKLFALLAIVGLIGLSSCQKLPSLSAKIADENYKALYLLAVHGPYDTTGAKGFLIIAGDDAKIESSRFLAIVIKGDQAVQYSLDLTLDSANMVAQCAAFYYPNGQNDSNNVYVANKGYVKLNTVDLNNNIINGTFEFDMVSPGGETIKITSGNFTNLYYLDVNDILTGYFDYNN